MKFINGIILCCVVLLSACNGSNNSNVGTNTDTMANLKLMTDSNMLTAAIDTSHNAQTALDWTGTYKGIVPCADCEGIETSLTLNKDHSFELRCAYLGKSPAAFVKRGIFSWKNANVIELAGIENAASKYFVSENKVFQLDMDGKRITGNLESKYILNKEAIK